MVPHGVGVEASLSPSQDVISWRQTTSTGKTGHQKVIIRQFAQTNNWLLSSDDPALNMTNTGDKLEMKREAGKKKLHRMAKIYDFWRYLRAARPYMIKRGNLRLKTSKRPT
jgi:hypothetical protein